jgi:Tfp pilus assembly PilM family ATPase
MVEINQGRVTKWGSTPIDPDIFKEEVIVSPHALGSAVKQLMSSIGIKENKVVASISSLYSLCRIVTVPTPLDQPVTEELVREASETVMPLSGEEMYLSWQTIAPGQGGQQVLLVGVPRDVLDSVVQSLKTAGVDSNILDIRTLALARAVNRKDALILNLDTITFDVVMVVDGFAEVLRTSAWLSEERSTVDKSDQLISALNLTLSFYDSHHPLSPISSETPIFVTGRLSDDLELIDKIRDEFRFPVEPLTPGLDYPEHFPVSQFAVNIGLATKAMSSPLNFNLTLKKGEPAKNPGNMIFSIPDINLLPRIYKPWRPSVRQTYAVLSLIAASSIFFPIYQTTMEAMRETGVMRQRFAAINTAMLTRKAELAKREPLQNEINQFDAIVARGGGFVDDLTAIRKLAAGLGIELQTINDTGSVISFYCGAPDYNTFRSFIKALEDNGRFTTPVIPPEGYPYIKGGTITLSPKSGG